MKSIDIANFFIDYNNHSIDNTLTNLILHKLLYFAQGYSLALYNTPLFDEDIEAWKYGPVVPSIYQTYKYNKKENISKIKGDFSLDKYDSKTIELLLAVINDYGKYSSSELINITHEKGSPWDMVYKENENNIISKESILKYFKNNNLAKINNTNLDNIEYIGKRDNTSKLLVLPADYDDKEDYSIYLAGIEK